MADVFDRLDRIKTVDNPGKTPARKTEKATAGGNALERLDRVKTVDAMSRLDRIRTVDGKASAPKSSGKAEARKASQPSGVSMGQGLALGVGGPSRQQVAQSVDRAEELRKAGYSTGTMLRGMAEQGGDQFVGGVLHTVKDYVEKPLFTVAGAVLGNPELGENAPVKQFSEWFDRRAEERREKYAENAAKGGTAYEKVNEYGSATVAAIPQALVALGTAGGSTAAQGLNAVAAASTRAPGILTTLKNVGEGLARNPNFWTSFLQVAGDGYEEAKADGASDAKAGLFGMVNGLANAAVEVGGGIQTLPAELQQGGKNAIRLWVESMVDEGKEEVVQGILERGLQNMVYDRKNPLFSTEDESAVVNPRTALKEFSGGAVVGGILGGGQMIAQGMASGAGRYAPNGAPLLVDEQGRTYEERLAAEQKNAAPRTEAAEVSLDEARQIARNFGAELRVGTLENGASGSYENGIITIDENAKNPVRQVLVHELTHHMEASGLYGEFSDRVLSFVAEDMGVDAEAMARSITEEYRAAGVELSEDAARRELVAKFAEDKLFRDEQSIRRLLRTDRNLFQKIYDWIRDTIVKVKGSSEEKFLADAQKLYEKALRNNQGGDALKTGQNLFAGERSKTADFAALGEARERLAQGADAETVRRETGWFRGMDGKWRFEIDDFGMEYQRAGDAEYRRNPEYLEYLGLWDKAIVRGEASEAEADRMRELDKRYGRVAMMTSINLANGNAKLGDILQHEDLFRAYPALRDVKVRFEDLSRDQNGYFDGRSNTIVLSNRLRNQPESTLTHEIQHILQKVEGFSRGASPEYWNRRMEEGYSRHRNDGRIERAEKEYRRIFDGAPEDFKRKVREINRNRLRRDYEAAEAIVDELYDGEYADLWSRLDMADFERRGERGEELLPSDLYRNTAGEIEARDAAARRSLTAEQRAEKAPDLGNENTVFAEGTETQRDYIGGTISQEELNRGVREVAGMEPVAEVHGTEFAKGAVDLVTQVTAYFDSLGNLAFNPQLGDVKLNRSGVKSDIGHGIGRKKAAAFAAVPRVLESGRVIDYQTNWKGRGYDTAVVAAPVTIQGDVYIAGVVLTRSQQENNFYLHEVLLAEKGAAPFKTGGRQSGNPGGDAPSVLSLLRQVQDVKSEGSGSVSDITPRLTDEKGRTFEERQNSMGRSFTELVAEQRRTAAGAPVLTDEKGRTFEERQAAEAREPETIRQPGVPDLAAESEGPVTPGDSGTDGYLDALAENGEPLRDPITPSDRIYEAKLDRLQREEAPPERGGGTRIAKRDLDEFAQLLQDTANPVTMAREARFEESAGLVSAETRPDKQTAREKAQEAKSYFLRKMVDAGDSVTRVAKATGDEYLYPFYNMARSSASAGINMIAGEQTDITGKRVGRSLNDIFQPIRAKGEDYYNQFQTYLFDLHNVDRMSLVAPDSTVRLEAEEALRVFDQENPDVAQMTEARLRKRAEDIDPDVAELARERLRLLRRVNQADRLGNKPVFSFEVSAEMSRERAAQLLRENPEFAEYRQQVREYIHNLMQYRVDSGLMTQQDMDFLERYYPNYVPTFRRTERTPSTKDRRNVRIGKTVGRAEGGNQKLVPLHEALGRQTMSVVREGSKNRFGERLLETWQRSGQDSQVRKYLLDAKEYDADFSLDTFDGADPTPKKENTFTVYKDGKQWEMQVDPSMFDAVKALSPDTKESNVVVKAIRAGNNLFKALVTGYNPTFVVRNTVRDLQTAGLYSRDGKAFLENYPLALREIKRDGAYWKQYKALGGSFSSVFDYQTGTVREPSGRAAKLAAKMEALNMAMEQAPRLAEFMSVVKAGDGSMENLMDAMHAAADVTVNFGRAGTLGKVLNANFVPFLNPGIQGFDKMIRRVTETKGAKQWSSLVVRAAALGIAPTLLNALLYSDDDEWEDLKDSDKDTNYLFKLKDGLWLKIPKGRELSILGMTADRVQDIVNGEDVDWGDFIATVGNQVAPSNPLRSNILAAWFDTDLFDPSSPGRTWYGGNIENQRLQNYAPGERYDSSTDVFSKWVGKQLGLSPKKINYLLDQYSGVVGDFLLPLLTPQAERDIFSKAFTLDSVNSNRLSGEFYDTAEELTYAANGGDSAAKAASRFWSKQQKACSDLYAEIREIEESDLSDKEKKQKVKEVKTILNGIQKNALAALETYEGTVEKYLKGDSEEDVDFAYREANRECFGAEYALQVYNKDVYEKAKNAAAGGVSYEDYYTYYFETKSFESSGGVSVATRKMRWLEASDLDDETKAEIYFADLASDSDLTKQAELESSSGLTAVEYWEYKMATNGIQADRAGNGKTIAGPKKQKVLAAIDSLDITKEQKTALYYAAGYAESTLTEAPWMGLQVPRLDSGTRSSRKKSSGKSKGKSSSGSKQRSGLDKYSLDKYKLGG